MEKTSYAEVVVNNRSNQTNMTYTYGIPKDLFDRVSIGSRVMVPFGKGNKLVEGYVLSKDEGLSIQLSKVKYIQRVLDEESLLSEKLIDLCKWMREEYLCTYMDAIQCIIPTGISYKTEKKIRLCRDVSMEERGQGGFTDRQWAVMEVLCKHPNVSEDALKQLLDFDPSSTLKSLEAKNIIFIEYQLKNNVNILTEKIIRLSIKENIHEEISKLNRNAKKQKQLLEYLANHGEVEWSKLKEALDISTSTLEALTKKGLVHVETVEKRRDPYGDFPVEATGPHVLTAEQKKVVEQVVPSIMDSKYQPFLLHGVTGSGKTEVYMQIIDQVLKQSKEAIVLVPEISLTPQMIERFKGRFGNSIAVLHSKLSLGERLDEWNRIKNGEVKIAVGARSAVFAPFHNLGIIIVDEEHEHTYKSESNPKYHAVEVAEFRCKQHGAVLLLGSATPSLESYYKAEKGEYKKLVMQNRYNKNDLPSIQIVDMRTELQRGNKSVFSESLYREIKRNLENKEQTILFLNRRGYSTFISCRNCGYVAKCPHCEISLTYHKNVHYISCHYCHYKQQPPVICPKCGSKYIKYFGAGTEKIEKVTEKFFPTAKIIRLDLDTTSRKGSMERIIQDIKQGKADIIIGTQMIAKGLDFPNVTLVGVIAADMNLNLPEFRAAERTFQLITQVAGRAGRGTRMGRVIVQTYDPEHFAIQASQNHDFISFYEQEILMRKEFLYPPFSRLINITIAGTKESEVIKTANHFATALRQRMANEKIPSEETVFGPSPAPLSRIKEKYRWQIVIKSKLIDQTALKGIINNIRNDITDRNYDNGISISIDINPFHML